MRRTDAFALANDVIGFCFMNINYQNGPWKRLWKKKHSSKKIVYLDRLRTPAEKYLLLVHTTDVAFFFSSIKCNKNKLINKWINLKINE